MLNVNGKAYDWGDVDLKIPGLNREASPAFPLTLYVNIKRRARASAFAETRAKICATEMTG